MFGFIHMKRDKQSGVQLSNLNILDIFPVSNNQPNIRDTRGSFITNTAMQIYQHTSDHWGMVYANWHSDNIIPYHTYQQLSC